MIRCALLVAAGLVALTAMGVSWIARRIDCDYAGRA